MKRMCFNIWVIALAALLWGCEFRPLEEPGFATEVNVTVNVEAVMNVTCDIYNEKIPAQGGLSVADGCRCLTKELDMIAC